MGLLDFARLKKFWEEKVKPYVQTSLEGYAKKTDLSAVATSGSYNDLTDKPEGGSAEIGDTIEVNKINFSYDGASTSTSITRDDDRLRIVSGDSISLSGGHAGSIFLSDPEETIYIEGEKKSVIHTYNGGGDTKISVEDDGQDTGLITIKGRKNVSMRSDGTLHIGVSDEYGSAINFYDDDSGIEIDTNNLLLGKVTQIYASSSKGSSDASSGEVGQVLTSNGDGELYWGDAPSGGTGDNSSITDLGKQNDHKCAQDAMFNSLTEAETGCYLFKYYCNCSETACFAIVYKFEGYVEGTVYDSNHRFRQFYYDTETGELIHDGCWLPIASWSDELETLKTDAKTVENAINELNSKVGSGNGAGLSMPRIRLANWKYGGKHPNIIYPTYNVENDEWSGEVIFSVNVQDGTVQEGDELQVCALKYTFGKRKLRAILSRTLTAQDIEELAETQYLQISTGHGANNTLGNTYNKVMKNLARTDSNNDSKNKPKYIRIRRPIYDADGMITGAYFSNVVPIDFVMRYTII